MIDIIIYNHIIAQNVFFFFHYIYKEGDLHDEAYSSPQNFNNMWVPFSFYFLVFVMTTIDLPVDLTNFIYIN